MNLGKDVFRGQMVQNNYLYDHSSRSMLYLNMHCKQTTCKPNFEPKYKFNTKVNSNNPSWSYDAFYNEKPESKLNPKLKSTYLYEGIGSTSTQTQQPIIVET
jgi:hypothetical protein